MAFGTQIALDEREHEESPRTPGATTLFCASVRDPWCNRTLCNRVEHFLDRLGMQNDTGMEGNHNPSRARLVDPMTALRAEPNETGPHKHRRRFRSGKAWSLRHELR